MNAFFHGGMIIVMISQSMIMENLYAFSVKQHDMLKNGDALNLTLQLPMPE
jgi:hypothetical protein